ncbi:MAG: hypothetical protein WCF90_06980 [Methanomicrobiales archaeon]
MLVAGSGRASCCGRFGAESAPVMAGSINGTEVKNRASRAGGFPANGYYSIVLSSPLDSHIVGVSSI